MSCYLAVCQIDYRMSDQRSSTSLAAGPGGGGDGGGVSSCGDVIGLHLGWRRNVLFELYFRNFLRTQSACHLHPALYVDLCSLTCSMSIISLTLLWDDLQHGRLDDEGGPIRILLFQKDITHLLGGQTWNGRSEEESTFVVWAVYF